MHVTHCLALLLLLLKHFSIDAFQAASMAGHIYIASGADVEYRPISSTRLLMAGSRRPSRSSSNYNSKNQNGSTKRKLGSKSFTKPTSAAKTTTTTKETGSGSVVSPYDQQKTPKVKKTAPPWQVLNPKEAKKNIQKEIERRSTDNTSNSSSSSSNLYTAYTPSTDNPLPILSKAFLSDTEARLLQWKPFSPYSTTLSVEFHGANIHTLPKSLGVPEIAFLGRSNVGKSSLLNALIRNPVARVGKTPGATASVNLYSISSSVNNNNNNNKPLLGMVDLPGFGYAKLSKSVQSDIAKLAEDYLKRRKELAVAILLVDIRREPKEDDKAVLAALYDLGVPVLIVATKLDKIDSETQRQNQLRMIQQRLGLPEGQPLAVSSVTGDGCRLLWRIIMEACEDHIDTLNQRYVEPDLPEDQPEDMHSQQLQQLQNDDDDDNIFDDHDDIVYEQGYDWVHGTVMLEDEDLDDEKLVDDGNYDDTEINDDGENWDRMTIQDWDRKSRDLQRRGLL